jgi:hypothetical protein
VSAQHTPGPWSIQWATHWGVDDGTNTERAGCFQILSDPNPTLANVLCTRTPWPERADEMRANARLIAAAPDLLAALEEARTGLQWYRDSFPEATDGSDDEAMTRIDAAIAKATGAAS